MFPLSCPVSQLRRKRGDVTRRKKKKSEFIYAGNKTASSSGAKEEYKNRVRLISVLLRLCSLMPCCLMETETELRRCKTTGVTHDEFCAS